MQHINQWPMHPTLCSKNSANDQVEGNLQQSNIYINCSSCKSIASAITAVANAVTVLAVCLSLCPYLPLFS